MVRATRATDAGGFQVVELVLVLPKGGLDPWCATARLNGSYPEPARPPEKALKDSGVSADLAADASGEWRVCNGSRPTERVERELLAHVAADGVVTAHLVAFEVGR